MSLDYGTLILYRSKDDCESWNPVKVVEIPKWVKELSPAVIARMVDGEALQDTTSETGSDWFILKRVVSPTDEARMQAAQAKRERKQRRRIVVPNSATGATVLH